ncbi:hypothetical protein LARI1_G001243 [Lachnellula arida]|uniref:Secreted protein n=1 Tax=Lachnellula arida TaxID=1316785 RepID=A0A8T9BNV7_9HELO|nr:hypothetical protein LARI1_G001243 [Lachnellula arida]
MYQTVLFAGFVALAAASPAAQGIDFASINAAPSPSMTGPPVSANSESFNYDTASANAAGSAAVTGIASASASGSQAVNSKRNLSPSTTTQKVSTGTSTTSSSTACATVPEAGTSCGFINPEDPCAVQPDGYGPHVTPDTVAAFTAYAEFHTQAQAARAPAGYTQTFADLDGSVNGNTYLGLSTLQSYDVPLCGQHCDSTALCTGFNIYVERDPSLNPSPNCTLPSSITNYKCTLWGSSVDASLATNDGQNRGLFQVVIAGSDGFTKTNTTTPAPCPGWQHPQDCGGRAHNHPSTCIGTSFFPGPYDPLLCASYAQAQNALNAKPSSWKQWTRSYNPLQCNFFNAFMLKKNGKPLGTYCGLYAQTYGAGDATYSPGWQGSDYWGIESSWGFSIN